MDDCVRLKVPGQRETQNRDPAGPQLHTKHLAQGPVHMEEGPLSTIFIMGSFRLGVALPEIVPLFISYA